MDRKRPWIYLGTLLKKPYILIQSSKYPIFSSIGFDTNSLNLFLVYFFGDGPCMSSVIAHAAFVWRDSILLERDSFKGWL